VAQGLLPALDRVVLLHRFVTEFPGGKHRAHHDPGLLAGRHEGQDRLEGVGVVAGLAVQQRDPLRRDDLGPGDPLLVVGPVRPVHHEVPLPADVELEGPRRRREPFRSPPPRQVPDLRERLEHQLPGGADHPGDHDLAVRGRLRRLAAATARRHPVVPPALPCFRFRAYSSSRSKVSFQNRSKPPTHWWTGRSPRASRPYSRCLPAPRTRTSPTSRSTRRCLDACGWVISRSRASSVTGRSPPRSSTRIPRRCGSAIPLNASEVVAARAIAQIICLYRNVSTAICRWLPPVATARLIKAPSDVVKCGDSRCTAAKPRTFVARPAGEGVYWRVSASIAAERVKPPSPCGLTITGMPGLNCWIISSALSPGSPKSWMLSVSASGPSSPNAPVMCLLSSCIWKSIESASGWIWTIAASVPSPFAYALNAMMRGSFDSTKLQSQSFISLSSSSLPSLRRCVPMKMNGSDIAA